MKYKFLLGIILWCTMPNTIVAQVTNFEQIVTPTGTRVRNFDEYLVQLAWQNMPSNEIFTNKVNIANEQLAIAKNKWKEDFQGAINLNEVTLSRLLPSETPTTNVVIFPIFNLSATFNLGRILNRKHDVAIRQEEIKISEAERNQRKLGVRAETLKRYQEYLLTIEILKERAKLEDDAQTKFNLISEMFKDGKSEIEDYNQASTAYHGAVESRLTAQTKVSLARISLEELIGVRYELAEQYYKRSGGGQQE